MPLCLRSLPKSGENTLYPFPKRYLMSTPCMLQQSEHPLILKLYFFVEGNTKKKMYVFSVSLSLTKSIDAILNKN